MKKFFAVIMLMITLTSCANADISAESDDSQHPLTLDHESLTPDVSADRVPLNYTDQRAVWLPYTEFDTLIYHRTEAQFRADIHDLLHKYQSESINTVYFHAHPEGDAYYDSELYPKGRFLYGDYDPLAIFLEISHSVGISVHAWLNPYRMQTADDMADLSPDFIVKKWVDANDEKVCLVNDRYYLVPAYNEVTELICATTDELLTRYPVDGIHIDDYFYPTTDESIDRQAFEASGSADLSEWRGNNVSNMVKRLYETVRSHGKRLKFGISPQGNIDTDYTKQYADVELWCSENGYADYIVPQIYFGFKNAVCPFEETLHRWESIAEKSDISLVIGLAEYKVGKEDEWAGDPGKDEWINDPEVLRRQIELVEKSTASGYALYK